MNKVNNKKVKRLYAIGGGVAVQAGLGAVTNAFNQSQIADTSTIGNEISTRTNNVPTGATNDALLQNWKSWTPMEHVHWKELVNTKDDGLSAIGGAAQGALAGAALSPIGGVVGGLIGGIGSLFGANRAKKKAKKKARQLNAQIDTVNTQNLNSFNAQVQGLDQANDQARLANFAAYGGLLQTGEPTEFSLLQEEDTNSRLKDMAKFKLAEGGKIHIKKANRGKFTASAKNAGMGVQEFAKHVLANKEDYSPTQVKRANFARNASKWKHELGGYLGEPNILAMGGGVVRDLSDIMNFRGGVNNNSLSNIVNLLSPTASSSSNSPTDAVVDDTNNNATEQFAYGGNLIGIVPNESTHGGQFSNGIIEFNEGGYHETNPHEGIPMGIGPDGTPNLVEEGEVRYGDYIFSDRLMPDNKLLKGFNLPSKGETKSFAKVAKKLQAESSERPNDPISKRGLEDSMAKLTQAQEAVRDRVEGNKYDVGGILKGVGAAIRYAPLVSQGLAFLGDTTGRTNNPDYSNAEAIERSYSEIAPARINNYLTYKPLDRQFYTNQVNAQNAATRRAIMNNSGGNRGVANAALLAAGYNATNQLGAAYRAGEEYNRAHQAQVAAFNRETDRFNEESAMRAQEANIANRIRTTAAGAELRERNRDIAARNKATNRANFMASLGNLGTEIINRNIISSNPDNRYKIDWMGNVAFKGSSPEEIESAVRDMRIAGVNNLNNTMLARSREEAENNYIDMAEDPRYLNVLDTLKNLDDILAKSKAKTKGGKK